MEGAPKRSRSCPAQPSWGARYRPQPLVHSAPFATSPLSFPANVTHTDSLSKSYPITQAPLDRKPPALATTLP